MRHREQEEHRAASPHPPTSRASWGSLDFLQAEFMEPPWFLAVAAALLNLPEGVSWSLDSQPADEETDALTWEAT